MKFIALDFETANSERGSACEIGLVKVENFKIIEKKSFLIKPKINYFDFYNTEIHGIDEEMVKNEPEFNEIYKLLKFDLENYPLIAHYATFDISVLRHTLDLYDIDYPETIYSCTYQLAKQAFKGELSYRLDALCKSYKIELEHHRALSDANACAEIAIKIFKEKEVTKFEDIEQKFDLRLGKLFEGGYKGSVKTFKNSYKLTDFNLDEGKFNPENPFYAKTVVFTGTLQSMTRKEAQIKILEVGGKCTTGLIKNTSYLILGEQDYSKYGEGFKSSKIKKAEKILSEGKEIELLTESQFIEMINNR